MIRSCFINTMSRFATESEHDLFLCHCFIYRWLLDLKTKCFWSLRTVLYDIIASFSVCFVFYVWNNYSLSLFLFFLVKRLRGFVFREILIEVIVPSKYGVTESVTQQQRWWRYQQSSAFVTFFLLTWLVIFMWNLRQQVISILRDWHMFTKKKSTNVKYLLSVGCTAFWFRDAQ